MDYNKITSEDFDGFLTHMRTAIKNKAPLNLFPDGIWDDEGNLKEEVMAGGYAYVGSNDGSNYDEYRVIAIEGREAKAISINAYRDEEIHDDYYFDLTELPVATQAYLYFEFCK